MSKFNETTWYQAITGKPFQSRPQLNAERDALVQQHERAIASFPEAEFECSEFSDAFCAVLDMYEAHLDAYCDLTDAEIDELCYRIDMPRTGFDRYVKIAKLQKQGKTEIERGRMLGKKWALNPTLLQ